MGCVGAWLAGARVVSAGRCRRCYFCFWGYLILKLSATWFDVSPVAVVAVTISL
jgi:hypothetical protein